MHVRTTLVTVAILAAALTACGTADHEQGKAQRAKGAPASKSADCGPDSNLSQSDWMDRCASASPSEKQANTELAVGDTFAYNDGVKVTVKSLARLTAFGEYDDRPDANQTGYRATWTVFNGTKKPLDVDQWAEQEQGATNGGEVTMLSIEKGSHSMTGRIAPGQTGTFTSENELPKANGTTIVVTMTRTDEGFDLLAEDPHWTGPIT
ncbi:hypothetical protein ACFYRN_24940 [Streptomyces sp. NPDC005227]|uniref:hypothetical protein n=1 Tax=Streptomyces sp. NPDC005227 TaxID=3364707 RepID=UPI00369FA91D